MFYDAFNWLIIVELDPGTNLQEDFEARANFTSFYRERYPQFKDRDEFRRLLVMYINLKQTWINSPQGMIKLILVKLCGNGGTAA